MIKLTVEKGDIKSNLEELKTKVESALAWLATQPQEVPLVIPEPFDHAVKGHPEATKACLRPVLDDCGDFGILKGVLAAMARPRK